MERLKRTPEQVPDGLNPIGWTRWGRSLPGLQNTPENSEGVTKKMLPQPGKFEARATQASVYENQNSVLVLALHFQIDQNTGITGYNSLSLRDGSLNERTINNLKDAFGWDGIDPFWFTETDLSQIPVQITVENQTREDGSTFTSVKYIDKPGSNGNGGGMPEVGDKRAILAKFGNRFRALNGGQHRAPAASAPPAAKKTAPPPPKQDEQLPAGLAPMDMNEAWGIFSDRGAKAKMTEQQIMDAWYAAIDATGKTADAMTPTDWAKVAANAPIPF